MQRPKPGTNTDDSELPDGFTCGQYYGQQISLDNCLGIRIAIERTYQVMAWQNAKPGIACDAKPRVRDLRPGTRWSLKGEIWVVEVAEIFDRELVLRLPNVRKAAGC